MTSKFPESFFSVFPFLPEKTTNVITPLMELLLEGRQVIHMNKKWKMISVGDKYHKQEKTLEGAVSNRFEGIVEVLFGVLQGGGIWPESWMMRNNRCTVTWGKSIPGKKHSRYRYPRKERVWPIWGRESKAACLRQSPRRQVREVGKDWIVKDFVGSGSIWILTLVQWKPFEEL